MTNIVCILDGVVDLTKYEDYETDSIVSFINANYTDTSIDPSETEITYTNFLSQDIREIVKLSKLVEYSIPNNTIILIPKTCIAYWLMDTLSLIVRHSDARFLFYEKHQLDYF